MKLLFLDIDGVLNSYQSTHYWETRCAPSERTYQLCPIACSNLEVVLDKVPDMDIVISSTWRIHFSTEELQERLGNMGIPSHRIRGCTPESQKRHRGLEIKIFLNEWKSNGFDGIDDFIIIDDDSDMDPFMTHLIRTDNRIGFSWLNVMEIFKRFEIYDNGACLF